MTLLEYLPDFYGGPEVRAIQGAVEEQMVELWKARDGLFDQLTVESATWGMRSWEEALGLPQGGERSLELRRSKIKAKLRGQGTTTLAMVRSVAESYTDMETKVLEHAPEYRVEFQFIGPISGTVNLEEISHTLAEILPTHLQYDYIFLHRVGAQNEYVGFGLRVGDTVYVRMLGGSE